ncbi:hypothetical protein [Deinococcus soli (ex Cha et al. 2016)]|uniref:hypothetical protein n=1 Tax=Deinococcus soli (ex Cha et al. 2016) TaxID=1309411 RepID=UPI0016674CA9|nr:hypothetical protein [Deinococcus soli (ex Cha et al. 2016)]GGB61175.1 hypothetical protein GCM10008019_16430 [Deinococcus soli (ex Cha et al. 2016)]
MRRILCLLLLCASSVEAQSTADVAKSIQGARREVIAVLPRVMNEAVAAALKVTAARGTRVFLITERATVKRGGYLLNVSHGPSGINTYLYPGAITTPWILVDGAWLASGAALDADLTAPVAIIRDAGTLSRLNLWATQVTAAGPTPRVDLLKLRYDQPTRPSPPRPAR